MHARPRWAARSGCARVVREWQECVCSFCAQALSLAMAACLREHLAGLNAHFDAVDEPCLKTFRLDEETVSFRVAAGTGKRARLRQTQRPWSKPCARAV